MDSLKRILFYTAKYWKQVMFSVITATLFGVFSAAPTYFVQYAVDLIVVNKNSYLMIPFMLIFIALFLFKGIFMFLSGYYMEWVGNRVMNDVRNDLLSKIICFPASFFQKKTTGELLSHFLNDISQIQNASSTAIRNGIRSFFEAVCLIIVAFMQNYKLALLLIGVGPVMVFVIRRMGELVRETSADSQKNMGYLSSFLSELFIGIREVKSFNSERAEINRFSSLLNKYFSSIMKNALLVSFAPACMEVIVMAGTGLVFYFAIHQILNGIITPGQLTSFFAAILLAYQPLKRLINVYSEIQTGLGAASRVFEIMDMEFPLANEKGSEIAQFASEIEFKNLSFKYEKSATLFSNVNLKIKHGQRIALIGTSGSGKSTFCDLLLKFVTSLEGMIFFDGVDITKISSESIRNQIGYVSQRPFLFNDTVFANVAYSKPNSTREEVMSACIAAFAHEFIVELPAQYETVVGENGILLSGGQKQRLTIARALLKNPKILIFDEATSALDQRSEDMIRESIQMLPKDKTIIIISHRMSFIDVADKVFLIKDRMIQEIDKIHIQNQLSANLFM